MKTIKRKRTSGWPCNANASELDCEIGTTLESWFWGVTSPEGMAGVDEA